MGGVPRKKERYTAGGGVGGAETPPLVTAGCMLVDERKREEDS